VVGKRGLGEAERDGKKTPKKTEREGVVKRHKGERVGRGGVARPSPISRGKDEKKERKGEKKRGGSGREHLKTRGVNRQTTGLLRKKAACGVGGFLRRSRKGPNAWLRRIGLGRVPDGFPGARREGYQKGTVFEKGKRVKTRKATRATKRLAI